MKNLTEPVKVGEKPLYEIASVLLFEMHLKEVLRAHTEVWVIHMLGRSYMLLLG
jgi:hypothetical protein